MSDAEVTMPVTSALVKATAEQSQFKAAPSVRAIGTPDPRTGTTKRGRGRPPGSKNKIQPPPNQGASQRVRIPPGQREGPSSLVDNTAATKEAKKARAEELTTYINQELNDKLFILMASMSGGVIKVEHFYKDGKAPKSVAANPNLSDLGNEVAIPADVAASWGKLITELTYTDAGKGLAKVGDNQSISIAIAAVAALFSTYKYGLSLKNIVDQVKEIQEKAKEQAGEQGNEA